MLKGHRVTGDGVVFTRKDRAKAYADTYDKDLAEGSNGEWLARNRQANSPPIPTKEGDIVIFHLHQLYRVWVTPWEGAQGGDPDVAPEDFWSADQATDRARKLAHETNGRIYRLQKDGNWTEFSN